MDVTKWTLLIIVFFFVGIILYLIVNKPQKDKDMILKHVIWNDQNNKEAIVFVDEINPRLKAKGHVAIHNVAVTSATQVPNEQVIFDLQAAAYHVTKVNPSKKYFVFMMSAVNGIDFIDPSSFSADITGIAKTL